MDKTSLPKSFFLWSDLPSDLMDELSRASRMVTYAPDQMLFPQEQSARCLCVLVAGEARVYAKSPLPQSAALLKTMQAGAIFGVHSIFNADMPPQSRIVATKPCRLALIPADVWENILCKHPPTMANYVRFLTQRVQFLNRKICYLTASSAEQRLSLYLISEITHDDKPTTLPLSAVELADLLDVGRASLYRAFDRLTKDGFLSRRGREYCLHRREELLGYYR